MDFATEKKFLLEKLCMLQNKLEKVEIDFQIELSDLIAKIKKAKANIKDDLFSIAFFGAFSDGKSTILSVLIKSLDIDISPEPTTDKIATYPNKDYQLIDTPGLFSDDLMHDKITRKYISEANLIIYTVDPVNPLKESHLKTVKWIMSDLKKTESTIFVVNKMDEVADLEDDNDFSYFSKIKKEVVSDVISQIIGSHKENKIVCIAADPYEMGLDYWQDNKEKYKRLSRIESLEEILFDFKSDYKNKLMLKAGLSVINDAIENVKKELNTIKENLISENSVLTNQIKEYENRVKTFKYEINDCYDHTIDDLILLRESILVEVDTANNMEELSKTVQKHVGKDGYILEEKINHIIRKYTNDLTSKSEMLLESIEESLLFHSEAQKELMEKISGLGKAVIKGLMRAPTRKIADAVLKTRNLLKVPFKFKPWGAMKFAKNLQLASFLVEPIEFISDVYSKITMDKKRIKLKGELEDCFKELLQQSLTIENYKKHYFPFLADIEDILKTICETKTELNSRISDIDSINNELSRIKNSKHEY